MGKRHNGCCATDARCSLLGDHFLFCCLSLIYGRLLFALSHSLVFSLAGVNSMPHNIIESYFHCTRSPAHFAFHNTYTHNGIERQQRRKMCSLSRSLLLVQCNNGMRLTAYAVSSRMLSVFFTWLKYFCVCDELMRASAHTHRNRQ